MVVRGDGAVAAGDHDRTGGGVADGLAVDAGFRVLAVEFLAVAESMDSRANWQGLVRVLAAVTLRT